MNVANSFINRSKFYYENHHQFLLEEFIENQCNGEGEKYLPGLKYARWILSKSRDDYGWDAYEEDLKTESSKLKKGE